MRLVILVFVCAVSCASCAAAQAPTPSAEAEQAVWPVEETSTDSARRAGAPFAPASLFAAIAGQWENGSCGDRHYLRRVFFRADGSFAAIDEVAPCPAGARCFWSGIIHWVGSWTFEGESIRLEPRPVQGDKLPDIVPSEFAIVSRAPFSIGEKNGVVVCPYRKKP